MAPDGKQSGISAFRLDRVLEAHAVKTELLSAVMARPELSELRLLTPYLRLDDAGANGNLFRVVADGVSTPLVFEKRGAKYELNRDSEKAFVKDTAFQGLYLKALKTSEAVERRFAALNGAVDEMPESFVVDFFASFPGFGGSVADEAVKAVTLSKKYMALAKFASVLPTAQSLRDVENLRHLHFDPVLLGVEHEAARIRSANRDKQVHGKDWSRDEVAYAVVSPITAIGTVSARYALLTEQFVNDVFSAGGSADLNERLGAVASFAYFTATVDAETMDRTNYADLSAPQTQEGLKRVAYCEYVATELLRTLPNVGNGIKKFESWNYSGKALVSALDHDPAHRSAPEALTPLETEYARVFDSEMERIKRRDGARHSEFAKLREEIFKPDNTGRSAASGELASVAGKPRSEQMKLIQQRVDHYVDSVFTESKYWANISLMLKARAFWQRLTQ